MALTNGIYFGNSAALKFFGPFEFNMKNRKLEFDFHQIAVLGLKIDLGRAGVSASEIGSATGLMAPPTTRTLRNFQHSKM